MKKAELRVMGTTFVRAISIRPDVTGARRSVFCRQVKLIVNASREWRRCGLGSRPNQAFTGDDCESWSREAWPTRAAGADAGHLVRPCQPYAEQDDGLSAKDS